jgi:hypothetical protein
VADGGDGAKRFHLCAARCIPLHSPLAYRRLSLPTFGRFLVYLTMLTVFALYSVCINIHVMTMAVQD